MHGLEHEIVSSLRNKDPLTRDPKRGLGHKGAHIRKTSDLYLPLNVWIPALSRLRRLANTVRLFETEETEKEKVGESGGETHRQGRKTKKDGRNEKNKYIREAREREREREEILKEIDKDFEKYKEVSFTHLSPEAMERAYKHLQG